MMGRGEGLFDSFLDWLCLRWLRKLGLVKKPHDDYDSLHYDVELGSVEYGGRVTAHVADDDAWSDDDGDAFVARGTTTTVNGRTNGTVSHREPIKKQAAPDYFAEMGMEAEYRGNKSSSIANSRSTVGNSRFQTATNLDDVLQDGGGNWGDDDLDQLL